MIEQVSLPPRLELFARRKRQSWYVWGNEVECDIDLLAMQQADERTQEGGMNDRQHL